MKIKKPFNPNDFDINLTVKDVSESFDYLFEINFKEVSLAKEITNLNYEVISKEYQDKKYSNIQDYFEIEVDKIV